MTSANKTGYGVGKCFAGGRITARKKIAAGNCKRIGYFKSAINKSAILIIPIYQGG